MFKRRQLQFPSRYQQACKIDTAGSFSELFNVAECENASRTKSPGGRRPSGKMARLPCKGHLKGTCTTPFCEKWHPPECLFFKTENGCNFGISAFTHTARLKISLAKGLKRMVFTTIGLRISGYGAAEVFIDFAEELKHTEANPMCSIHQSRIASRQHSRPKTIAWSNLPRGSSSAQPQCTKK